VGSKNMSKQPSKRLKKDMSSKVKELNHTVDKAELEYKQAVELDVHIAVEIFNKQILPIAQRILHKRDKAVKVLDKELEAYPKEMFDDYNPYQEFEDVETIEQVCQMLFRKM
jgi:preprotein translocase subunit SecD